MAHKCSHSDLLDTKLKPCSDTTPLVASSHESYLKIIDDLKNDLEQISCEVVMVQKECSVQEADDVDLERSLRELEIQNDRLEQALQLETLTRDAALTQLQTHNEALNCQITQLQATILERDQHIVHLTGLLRNNNQRAVTGPYRAAIEYNPSRNDLSSELEKKIEVLTEKLDKSMKQEQFLRRETRKLNEELNEYRKKNSNLITQAHRVGALLKCQEANTKELNAKYEALEQNYEDQARKLRAANNQLSMIDARVQSMEKRQIEHNTERNLLRDEVLSLKEKHACALGHQKCMQEQLVKSEKELFTAHDVIKEQTSIMQRNESLYNDGIRRLQETNAELKKRVSDLIRDYKTLQEEYDKQREINSEQLKLLEILRKWKQEQLRAEQKTRDGFKMYQEFISDMLEHKKKLLQNFHELHRDYSLLQNEMDRLKMCPLSLPPCNSILDGSERSISERLEMIQRTTSRLLEQSSSFQDDQPIALRAGSNSSCKPSDEAIKD